MKRISLLAVLALLIAMPAFAQDLETVCRIHESQKNISGAAYAPGGDVQGKPVVPADVAPSPSGDMAGVIKMPMTIDLMKMLAAKAPGGMELKGAVGMLEIRRGGEVWYNGANVSGSMTSMCENRPPRKPEVSKKKRHRKKPVENTSAEGAAMTAPATAAEPAAEMQKPQEQEAQQPAASATPQQAEESVAPQATTTTPAEMLAPPAAEQPVPAQEHPVIQPEMPDPFADEGKAGAAPQPDMQQPRPPEEDTKKDSSVGESEMLIVPVPADQKPASDITAH